MSLPEVCWRLQQKNLQNKEKKDFDEDKQTVISSLFDKNLKELKFNPLALGLNFSNDTFGTETSIHLLGGYQYEEYKTSWNAGFQTNNKWGNEFSYSLNYKQRDDIGDARTNWELNRHFQYALLAKAFFVTGDRKYYNELRDLFYDWNEKNPFLHGISWTSVMEVAIRCIQWSITMAFLSVSKGLANDNLLKDLEAGVKNMAYYISMHYSRYSSANNHLLVEATAIAFAGFAFDVKGWKMLAINILDEELYKQNYSDGVNKEMSLHYQTFGMEAYALVMHLLQCNKEKVPNSWISMLSKQCEFVASSMVSETTACEFGDNDEGKILDLEGGEICHYRYLLQLCSLVLGKRYETFERPSETINWLFSEKGITKCIDLPLSSVDDSRTFPNGGYSFLRSNDKKIVVGIDHAPLGFGSIAAHGHADALSLQLYVDGQCILGDPGTFIYHCWIDKRNEYRKSCNHNTVWTKEEQSQLLGAFLWGKKAKTSLTSYTFNKDNDIVCADSVWQNGDKHERKITFDKNTNLIRVHDVLNSSYQGFATLIVYPECDVKLDSNNITVKRGNIRIIIESSGAAKLQESWYSELYGIERKTKKVIFTLNNNKLDTTIWIEKY